MCEWREGLSTDRGDTIASGMRLISPVVFSGQGDLLRVEELMKE